ncbi:MAG: Holliday junction resolvase RuvX [Sphaerobacteraceae bacterium]|nr:MAG: Holliday junction resolvase RuvX [Sphaerobacteraceae bacterium]
MSKQLPGRRVALDAGGRRIGLAVSDELGMVASPVRTIDLKREGLDGLIAAIRQYEPVEIIIGMPTGMSGHEGPQADAVRLFAGEVAEKIDLPITYWDERLTTFAADMALQESGHRSRKSRKEYVDAVAASLILQSFLDSVR